MSRFILQLLYVYIFLYSNNAMAGQVVSSVLSPDKTLMALIRKGNQVIPSECKGYIDNEARFGGEIWIRDTKSRKEKLLVPPDFQCGKPERQIIDPRDLQFSPDGKILYFTVSAWTTSGALHAVNIAGMYSYYVVPANSFEVIQKGQYKGYLVVQQHRYFVGGGSYDWYWLFTPQGKSEGPLGEDISQNQREFLEANITRQ